MVPSLFHISETKERHACILLLKIDAQTVIMLAADPLQEYVPEDMTEPEFGSVILQSFNEFRQDGLFCDFKLRVEYETFNVSAP